MKIHLSVLNYTITQLLWWKYFNSDWSNYLIIRQRSTITNTYQDNMDLRSASQETTQRYRTEQRAQIWPSVLVPAFFSFAFCGLLSRTRGSRTDSRSHAKKNGYKNITSLINTSQQKRAFGETAESSKLNPYKFYSSLYYSYLLVATTEIFLFFNFYNTELKSCYGWIPRKVKKQFYALRLPYTLTKTFILQNSITFASNFGIIGRFFSLP